MPKCLNRVFLIGHLGANAEIRNTGGGVSVASFSLATTRRFKSGDEWKDATDWHRVVLWRVDKLGEYLTKGRAVHIEGRLQTRSYEDKSGEKRYVTEVIAENLILLGGGKSADDSQPDAPVSRPRTSERAAPSAGEPEWGGATDDDIPF